MKRVVVALGLSAALAGSACAADDWAIVWMPSADSPVRAGDLPARPTGAFALTVVNGLWNLVPAELKVKGAHHGATDDDEVTLVATPAGAPFYLHATGLAAGKVDTPDLRFKGVQRDAFQPIALPFKGAPWAFEIKSGATWFTDGSLHQKIFDALPADENAGERDMESATLLWAGDLDHDGKLDFIIDRSFDDGGRTCLWLSSRAKPGQLVGQAGCQDHQA